MPLKRYEGTHAGTFINKPAITLSKTGRIHINAAAAQHFEGYDYADLYYDEETRRVGIQPKQERQTGTLKLISRAKSRGFGIVADGFYKVNGIQYEVTTAYSADWDNEEGMLIASLDNPVSAN